MKILFFLLFLLFNLESQSQFGMNNAEWEQEISANFKQIQFYPDSSIRCENIKIKNKLIRFEYYENGKIRLRVPVIQEQVDTLWGHNLQTGEAEAYYTKVFMDSENGILKEYYENGDLKTKKKYKKGHLIGKSSYYWNNQVIQKIIYWDKNTYMKKYFEFYENGQVEKKGRYKLIGNREVKNGVWKYYDINGKLVKKKSFNKKRQ